MRVLLYAKMRKETENKETRLFCEMFVIGGILIAGAGTLRPTPWLRLWFWNKIVPFSS